MHMNKVANALRNRINNGTYQPGAALPTRRTLAAEFAVAPMTIQRAIRVLVDEGLVRTRVGSGVYVRDDRKGRTPMTDEPVPVLVKRFREASHAARRVYSKGDGVATTEFVTYMRFIAEMFEVEEVLRGRLNTHILVTALHVEHEMLTARTMMRRTGDFMADQLLHAQRTIDTVCRV